MRLPLPALLGLGLLLWGFAPPAHAGAEPDLGRVRRLTDDLRSRYVDEREAAESGLIGIVRSATDAIARPAPGADAETARVAREMLHRMVQAMAEALNDPDSRVRNCAADVLAVIPDPDALPTLLNRSTDLERAAAAQVLQQLDGRTGLYALQRLLDARNGEMIEEILKAVAKARAENGDETALRALATGKGKLSSLVAAEALQKIGTESAALRAVKGAAQRLHATAADTVLRLPHPAAVAALIEALECARGEACDRLIRALILVGPAAREAILRRAKGSVPESSSYSPVLRGFTAIDVEAELEKLITDRGSYGFYSGQFAEIVKIGKPAVAILLGMFTQPAYPFLEPDPKRRHIMRSLAGEALADMGDASVVPILSGIFDSETGAAELAFDPQELEDSLGYILFRLGEKQKLSDMAHKLDSYLECSNLRNDLRPRLAGLLVRMSDYAGAEDLYKRMIMEDPQRGEWAHYNLACLFAVQNKKSEALKHLKRAVDGGFGDVAWIKQDGDLKNLHGDPTYEQIIREAEEDDRFGDRKPQ